MLAEIDGIQYSSLEQSDRESVSDLVARDYFKRQEVIGTMDLDAPKSTMECGRAIFDACFSDGISAKAVDPTNGRVVGVRLSYVSRKGEPNPLKGELYREMRDGHTQRIHQKVLDSLGVLLYVDGLMPPIYQQWNVEEYVAFVLINVSKNYDDRGIAQHLLDFCYKQHEKKGIRVVKVLVSSPKTKHIFTKQGFDVVAAFPVKEYLVNGERFFKDVPENKEIYGLVKQFGYKNTPS